MRTGAISKATLVLIAILPFIGCSQSGPAAGPPTAPQINVNSPAIRSGVGFASRQKLQEHYEKHGGEFGSITIDQYLRQAQALRDRPAGGNVLEFERTDGVVTRYDRDTGAFIAFDADGTIRTYFKPNAGERYFERQRFRD